MRTTLLFRVNSRFSGPRTSFAHRSVVQPRESGKKDGLGGGDRMVAMIDRPAE